MGLGRAFGQDYRSIAAWNKISDKDDIQVGQVLRIKPPPVAVSHKPAPATPSAPVRRSSSERDSASEKKTATKSPAPAPAPSTTEAQTIDWKWPAQGRLVKVTDRNLKGIAIGGSSGQPVWTSAPGTVTYAGHGVRGYGNMIIIKHSRTLLSVYAHNKMIMVKEGQTVNRGQQIAQMGDTDSKTVKLYFEIRSNGKPINPLPLLPKNTQTGN